MSLRDKQAIPISSAALSALSSFQRRKKREAILNHPPNSGKSLEISSLNCWRAELRERSFISTITLWKVHIIALPACLENKAADQPALLLLSPSVFTLEQLTSFSSLLFSSLLFSQQLSDLGNITVLSLWDVQRCSHAKGGCVCFYLHSAKKNNTFSSLKV